FPETVVAARRDPCEVETGGAETADAGDFGCDGTEDAAPLRHIAVAHIGDARRDQAFVEVAARCDAKPPVVEPGAAAALGPIALVGDRLIAERRRYLAPAAAGF